VNDLLWERLADRLRALPSRVAYDCFHYPEASSRKRRLRESRLLRKRHGTEIRHIALHKRDGKLFVVVPVYRTSQMGVMTVRSEAKLAALMAKTL